MRHFLNLHDRSLGHYVNAASCESLEIQFTLASHSTSLTEKNSWQGSRRKRLTDRSGDVFVEYPIRTISEAVIMPIV